MFRIRAFKLFLVSLSATILLTGCPEKGCDDGVPAILLDYTGLSGCKWVIQLQNGERLEPVNLHEFDLVPADSMIVHITYTEAPTMMSICMVGKMVEITCIAELSDDYKDYFNHSLPQNTYDPHNEPPDRVMAYPDEISYRLPDGYLLNIYLRGDEYSHTATTKDGYLLIMNQDGFYEYAIKKDGRLQNSGIVARNKEDRDEEVIEFLKTTNQ